MLLFILLHKIGDTLANLTFRLLFDDLGFSNDEIALKIRKAKTDPEPLPEDPALLEQRPEARNLIGIYAAMVDEAPEQVLARFSGKGFGAFKPALADAAIALLEPLRERLITLRKDEAALDSILTAGAEKAANLAAPTLAEAYRAVGLKH